MGIKTLILDIVGWHVTYFLRLASLDGSCSLPLFLYSDGAILGRVAIIFSTKDTIQCLCLRDLWMPSSETMSFSFPSWLWSTLKVALLGLQSIA